MSLTIPKYPPAILTPPPLRSPNNETLHLLEKVCKSLIKSDEVYSVTYSPVLCPAGKNYLFTLKPYWWQVDGRWEHRDGKRNPYCDAPRGQKQLENLSTSIWILALGRRYLSQEIGIACASRASLLLRLFFSDEDTKMYSQVLYAQCHPGKIPLKGDQAFVIAARYLILVSQSLGALSPEASLEKQIREWFDEHVRWMRTSVQGASARGHGNNISVWYQALIVSHLAYIRPEEAISESLSWFTSTVSNHPSPSTFFARELQRSRPRHYTLFTLEPTFIIAFHTGAPPPDHILAYLEGLVRFARSVRCGQLEVELEEDSRYIARLEWFERMLGRWGGKTVREEGGPDGRGWEGGWNQQSRLAWGFL